MRTRIVPIGNSRGVLLPQLLLDQAGLHDEVEIHAEPGRIIIGSAARPSAGWADAAREMAAEGEDGLLEVTSDTTAHG
jgi:antitoxin MazE